MKFWLCFLFVFTEAFVVPPPLKRPALPRTKKVVPREASVVQLSEIGVGLVGVQALACFSAAVVGFGDALVVIPLLAICYGIGPEIGAPLVSLVSIAMFSSTLAYDWATGRSRRVGRWRESAVLAAGAAVGVPIGVKMLLAVSTDLIQFAIGTFLIVFGTFKLRNSGRDQPPSDEKCSLLKTVLPCGIASGILGGVLSAPGPPAVVLSRLARWDAPTTRVMLFRFFLPVQILASLNFWRCGLITSDILRQALMALPAVAAAVVCGTYCNRRIPNDSFDVLVASVLVLLGTLLAYTSGAQYVLYLFVNGARVFQ